MIDFLVSVDVVNNAVEVLLAGVSVDFPAELSEDSFRDGQVSTAHHFILNADVLIARVFVVADKGKAFWHNNNWISLHNVSL